MSRDLPEVKASARGRFTRRAFRVRGRSAEALRWALGGAVGDERGVGAGVGAVMGQGLEGHGEDWICQAFSVFQAHGQRGSWRELTLR